MNKLETKIKQLEEALAIETKEVKRLRTVAKKDFSDGFGKYVKFVNENDVLIEKLAVKYKAHEIACDGWAYEQKNFNDYKENLLLKAEQYEREQEYFVNRTDACEDLEYNKAVLTGVTRIVSLIKRFNKIKK